MLRPGKAVARAFRRSLQWRGRSRRSEFWWFQLFAVLVELATGFIDGFTGAELTPLGYAPLSLVVTLVLMPTSVTVSVRRVRDIGLPGAWAAYPLTVPIFLPDDLILWHLGLDAAVIMGDLARIVSLADLVGGGLLLALIVLAVLPGQDGPNRFGPDPKSPGGNVADVFG